MEEKILVKSENEKNYFITIGVAILVGGFCLALFSDLIQSRIVCIHGRFLFIMFGRLLF